MSKLGIYECPEPIIVNEVQRPDMSEVMTVVRSRGIEKSPDTFSICGEGAEQLGSIIFGDDSGLILPDQYMVEGPGSKKAGTVNYRHIDLNLDDRGNLVPIAIDIIAFPEPTWWLRGEVPGLETRDLCYMYDDLATSFITKKIADAIQKGYAKEERVAENTYTHLPEGTIHWRPPIEVFDEYRIFGKRFVEDGQDNTR